MHYLLKEMGCVIEECDKKGNDRLLLPFARMVSAEYDYYVAKALGNPEYFMDLVKFFGDYTVKRETNPPAVISFKKLKHHALKYKEELFLEMPDDLARKLAFYFLTHFDKFNARRVFEISKGPSLIAGEDKDCLFELYKREKSEKLEGLEGLLSERPGTGETMSRERNSKGI